MVKQTTDHLTTGVKPFDHGPVTCQHLGVLINTQSAKSEGDPTGHGVGSKRWAVQRLCPVALVRHEPLGRQTVMHCWIKTNRTRSSVVGHEDLFETGFNHRQLVDQLIQRVREQWSARNVARFKQFDVTGVIGCAANLSHVPGLSKISSAPLGVCLEPSTGKHHAAGTEFGDPFLVTDNNATDPPGTILDKLLCTGLVTQSNAVPPRDLEPHA